MSKMKCISNNIQFVFAFGKIRIFDDLCDLSKTCHPINDPSSRYPMWRPHCGPITWWSMAWQLLEFHSKIQKFQKTWNFSSWNFMIPEDFSLAWRNLQVRSPFLQILVLHLFSFLFFYSRPFFYYLFFMSWIISFFLYFLSLSDLSSGLLPTSSLLQIFSEDLQNRTSTRSVGLL